MAFRDWRFRNKLLAITLVPVLFATGSMVVAFSLGLERVWQGATRQQTSLLRLDSLAREYQSEIREFVLLGQSGTRLEVLEIEEEIPSILAELTASGPAPVAVASPPYSRSPGPRSPGTRTRAAETTSADAASSRIPTPNLGDLLRPSVEALLSEGHRLLLADLATGSRAPTLVIEDELSVFEQREQELEELIDHQVMAARAQVLGALSQFRGLMLASASVAALLALLSAVVLSRWLTTPLGVLAEASRRLLEGEYRAADRIVSHDELGELAEAVDSAGEQIRLLVEQKEQSLRELREHQAQLVHTGKLAAVGVLAAGVAHEINNPLSAVLTYGVLLREKAERAPPELLEHVPHLVERLSLIETAGLRCKDIADKLLTFARQDEAERVPIELAAVVEDALDLVRPLVHRRAATLESRLVSGARVLASASQMQQVVMNLVANAVQAVEAKGRLEVTIEPCAEGWELAVRDDGAGIDPEVLDRIFDPFVTTKGPGEGTGLGLSIVHGIVEAHGGQLRAESEPGEGSTFRVWLPAIGVDAERARVAS